MDLQINVGSRDIVMEGLFRQAYLDGNELRFTVDRIDSDRYGGATVSLHLEEGSQNKELEKILEDV